MSMTVTLRGASVAFADGTRALDDVTLTVPAGQFCVLLGASGAGKSTLLRSIVGLAPLRAGEIRVGDRKVESRSLRDIRARIGMIHQNFGLSLRASVANNLIAGSAAGMPLWRALSGLYPQADRERACRLLQAVGLDEAHLARRAEQLSGGQQQRVGIARAFMRDPALILADEPVASLDPRTARAILEMLHMQASSRGATVLCSLHQLDLARTFADRIVALRAGRIVFDGTAADLQAADAAAIYQQVLENAA